MDMSTQWILHRFRLADQDEQYFRMKVEYLQLQKKFEDIVREMPEDKQDVLWGFVTISEGMNWRMLELLWESENLGK